VDDTSASNRDASMLELAQPVVIFRQTSDPAEKRRLIQKLHSNSAWKDDKLLVEWRQPFGTATASAGAA